MVLLCLTLYFETIAGTFSISFNFLLINDCQLGVILDFDMSEQEQILIFRSQALHDGK